MQPQLTVPLRVTVLLCLTLLAGCNTSLQREPARTAIVAMTKDGVAYAPSTNEYLEIRGDIATMLAAQKLELSERPAEATYLVTLAVTDHGNTGRVTPFALIAIESNPYRRVSTAGWRGRTRSEEERSSAAALSNHGMHPSIRLAEELQRIGELTPIESPPSTD